jgi:DNA-binding LacI/PurR family transcriptional regulator
MQPKYTIRDIARLAGFSFKTVSRVINDEPNVKPDTKEKIMKVIEETNYKPNMYAKNLNNKTVTNILISIRKTRGQNTTQWFDIFLSHMIQASQDKHYTIIQEIIYDDSELIHSMMEQSSGYIDVLVLFYLEENDQRMHIARKNNIPYISFEKNKHAPISISNNNRQGMTEATRFLFGRKLTRICLLLGAHIEVNIERANAIMDAYKEYGIPLDHLEIVYHMNNLEKIKQFVDDRIETDRLPEVFFVSGDEKAIAVYHSVYRHGLTIPKDVSIIGFDNIPISQYYYPPLTTMGQDFEELANEMFIAIEKLLNKEPNVASVAVDSKLIIRESVK